MFTIIDAGTNPLYENHPVYVVYREDGSYWGTTTTTALDVLTDGLAQELGGRYRSPRPVSLKVSSFEDEVAFDTVEGAESALHFVAQQFAGEGFFVRADDGWFTAATADDYHAGYVRLWFPIEETR